MKKPAVTSGGLPGTADGGETTTSVPSPADRITTPRPYEVRSLPRKRCRITSCTETIPYSIGYAPDWVCWRHHALVAPPLEAVSR